MESSWRQEDSGSSSAHWNGGETDRRGAKGFAPRREEGRRRPLPLRIFSRFFKHFALTYSVVLGRRAPVGAFILRVSQFEYLSCPDRAPSAELLFGRAIQEH